MRFGYSTGLLSGNHLISQDTMQHKGFTYIID